MSNAFGRPGRMSRYSQRLITNPSTSCGPACGAGATTGPPRAAACAATVTSRASQAAGSRRVHAVRVATRASTGAGARCTSRLPRSDSTRRSSAGRPSPVASPATAERAMSTSPPWSAHRAGVDRNLLIDPTATASSVRPRSGRTRIDQRPRVPHPRRPGCDQMALGARRAVRAPRLDRCAPHIRVWFTRQPSSPTRAHSSRRSSSPRATAVPGAGAVAEEGPLGGC